MNDENKDPNNPEDVVEKKKGKWKARLAKFAEKIGDKLKNVLNDAWELIAKKIGPEVWAFVLDNREIIEKAIMDTALHYADEPDHIKFQNTMNRLKKELIEAAGEGGENIDIPDSWLGFGIHAIILLLKAQGKI